MTVLIDADSLIYIIAWTYREEGTEEDVKRSCDFMLRDILTLTQGEDYIGAFSPKQCFRHDVYKYAPYKGNRKSEKPEWLMKWDTIIKRYYMNTHGFTVIPRLEADDVVAGVSLIMQENSIPCIICSPDKDLRQIPGLLYQPKKQGEGQEWVDGQLVRITPDQADYTFWLQMLCGDGTDNVAGVPGLGEVKGKKLLDEALDPMMYPSIVLGAFCKYFGSHYGNLIFEETKQTLMMMRPEHALWESFKDQLMLLPLRRRIFKPQYRAIEHPLSDLANSLFDV